MFLDWLFHRYIRKGERLLLIEPNGSSETVTVTAIEGRGKYAAVFNDTRGPIRRDGIRWVPGPTMNGGWWEYRYGDGGGE